MIQANDLRIGNYVKGIAMGLTHKIDLHFFNECYDDDTMLDWYMPIKLSPEVLENTGFKWYDNDWYEIKSKINISIELHSGYIYFGKGEYLFKANIIYLHQLQNLYFALTKEELKIEDL